MLGPKILLSTEGHKPSSERRKHRHILRSVPQPCLRGPKQRSKHQRPARPTAGCREGSPLPALTMPRDHIFQKRSVYSGNHLQAPSSPKVLRPPKLPETIKWTWGGRNLWLSWTDNVLLLCTFSSIFNFFLTILKSDRLCRPFCPETWAPSKALFLKQDLFTLPAPGTSSVS